MSNLSSGKLICWIKRKHSDLQVYREGNNVCLSHKICKRCKTLISMDKGTTAGGYFH